MAKRAKKQGYYVKIDAGLLAELKAKAKADGTTVIAILEAGARLLVTQGLSERYRKAHPPLPPIELSPRDQQAFAEALLDPPAPNERLKAAARRAKLKPPSHDRALDVGGPIHTGGTRRCLGCKHPKEQHWAKGCVAGCNCSERRFR